MYRIKRVAGILKRLAVVALPPAVEPDGHEREHCKPLLADLKLQSEKLDWENLSSDEQMCIRDRSNAEDKASRLADRLVPYTLGGTILTYLITRNVTKMLAVLMVDFSCALKLSMPIAVLSATVSYTHLITSWRTSCSRFSATS